MNRYKYERTRTCDYCGKEYTYPAHATHRKYCSRSCGSKASYNKKTPGSEGSVWSHDKSVFDTAMEMYWSGISSAEIARDMGIPAGTIYSWVHDFGGQRERITPIIQYKEKPTHIKPLKERFRLARNTDEWLEILHNSDSQDEEEYENAVINLVCGKLHGQSAGKLAALVYEKLKCDPCSGKTYAFCNKCGNAITTISWNKPIYHIERYVRTHGTFIWPDEKLGKSIEITRAVFERLVSLQKYRKNAKSIDIMRFSYYN